ncbi:MAG: hypothetical protein JWN72_2723 [Thermoleophilia bacterium]|nr:hypothetical protein [Thermoleophilia bacterium]
MPDIAYDHPVGPKAVFTGDDERDGSVAANPWGTEPPRRFVAWLLSSLVLLLAIVFAFDYYVDATGVTGRDTKWNVVENAKDRTIKLDYYERLEAHPPQTVLLGSSRVMKFEPSVVEEITGDRTFNAAVSGGTPEDALLFVKLIAQRQPTSFPHLVWGVDVDAFRDKQLRDGLAQDPRTQQFLSTRRRVANTAAMVGTLLEWQTLKTSVQSLQRDGPEPSRAAKRTYAPDGFQEWELHPVARTAFQLRQQVATEMRQYTQAIFVRDDYTEVEEAPTDDFRELIRIANRHGDVPTVFLTPYQPGAKRFLDAYDIDARTREVRALLQRLQGAGGLRFEVADFTDVEQFGGDPAQFYDGVHMTTANTSAALRELGRRGLLTRP